MNRGTMKDVARRRLQELTADDWTDVQIYDLLNQSAIWVEKQVLKQDPLAFVSEAFVPLAAGVDLYSKPEGLWWEMEVGIKNGSASLGYLPLEKKDYNIARRMLSGNLPVYCHVGRFFGIYPIPTETIASGIRILFTPTLSMAQDTDVLDLHLGLHMAVVLKAVKYGLPEVSDGSMDELKKELDEEIADLPTYYQKSATENERLWIDPNFIDQGYQRNPINGIYTRGGSIA